MDRRGFLGFLYSLPFLSKFSGKEEALSELTSRDYHLISVDMFHRYGKRTHLHQVDDLVALGRFNGYSWSYTFLESARGFVSKKRIREDLIDTISYNIVLGNDYDKPQGDIHIYREKLGEFDLLYYVFPSNAVARVNIKAREEAMIKL